MGFIPGYISVKSVEGKSVIHGGLGEITPGEIKSAADARHDFLVGPAAVAIATGVTPGRERAIIRTKGNAHDRTVRQGSHINCGDNRLRIAQGTEVDILSAGDVLNDKLGQSGVDWLRHPQAGQKRG